MADRGERIEPVRQELRGAMLRARGMLLRRGPSGDRHHHQAVLRPERAGMARARLAWVVAAALAAWPVLAAKLERPPRVAPWTRDPFPSTYRAPDAPAVLIIHAVVLDGAGH